MMELVQGEGGVLPLDRDYVKAVARLCAEKDWLLLVDEVQTGVGRTGSLFAFQQYGILPDVASFAKGIAGGLPMSGILANEKCRDVLGPGTHATTFGANPVCAAAGLVVQETLTDAFLEDVRAKGTYLRNQIEALDLPCFGATRGMGLMIGIQVKDGWTNKEIASKLIENGLLVLTAGPGMRLLPPLVISQEEMDQGLEILKRRSPESVFFAPAGDLLRPAVTPALTRTPAITLTLTLTITLTITGEFYTIFPD